MVSRAVGFGEALGFAGGAALEGDDDGAADVPAASPEADAEEPEPLLAWPSSVLRPHPVRESAKTAAAERAWNPRRGRVFCGAILRAWH